MTTDVQEVSRRFVKEFIELYKSCPSLWRVKSTEYSDRNKKSQDYETLIEKYKETDPTANREKVVKKINSLRSACRKEKVKVKEYALRGIIYKPSLWYFDLFSFLNSQDQDTTVESRNTTDDDEPTFAPQTTTVLLKQEVYADQSDTDGDVEEMPPSPGTSTSSRGRGSASCFTFSSQSPPPKRKPPPYDMQITDVMSLGQQKSLNTEDSFDIFGKYIANKLRTLKSKQNIFAQKLINDVLFEAEMESLTRSFKIVDSKDITYNCSIDLDRLDRTEINWCIQNKNQL